MDWITDICHALTPSKWGVVLSMLMIGVYTFIVCHRNQKIPQSLSATVFDLPKGYVWVWSAVIFASLFLVAPALFIHTSPEYGCFAWFALTGLLFVGCCPLVPDKHDIVYKIHMIAAYLCVVSANVIVALECPLLLFLWVVWLYYALYRYDASFDHDESSWWFSKKFWAEMVTLVIMYAFCLI